jgi:hypothetical protein
MSAPSPHDTPIPEAAARAHAALMKHDELQFDYPRFAPPKPPDWLVKLLDFLGWLLKPILPYLNYLWWMIVIATIALVVFLIARSLIRRGIFFSKKTQRTVSKPEWRPAPETARLLLSDADALAAQGRYAEAIHLILLRSIQEIARHRPAVLKPALTSREIGELRELPEAARIAFVHIARVVERALFAGREVGQREYAECREAYERFAFPDVWSLRAAA